MKLRTRWVNRLIGRMIATLARALFRLVRVEVREAVPHTSAYDVIPERYLYCLWHEQILGIIFGRQPIKMAGLVSRHTDGSYVADAMECVRLKPIRGSSQKGGAAALAEMIEVARSWHIAIATDGPRGPRHVVKEGIIFLAAQTGKPVVPVGLSATRAWRPRGRWTDMIVPKPFSKMLVLVGEPIPIPASATREERETWRQLVQAKMDALRLEAEMLTGSRTKVHEFPAPKQKAARKAA
jgi:lysophospholipid acyltransferase (LPLAT)-like uncharacterized protein